MCACVSALACAAFLGPPAAHAADMAHADHHAHGLERADSQAPIGVMADHYHHAGGFMFTYRYMHMRMDGNLDGNDSISADEIVTTVPNRFFGQPNQPPTLRIVPTRMTMDMHMFEWMYAPTDWLTLMAMGNWTQKKMDHVTYQGPTGTTRLGEFTTRTDGWGDTRLSGLFRLRERPSSRLHGILGVSVPTGDTTATDTVLTPMNTQPEIRLPYPMQLGSGTYDVITGLSFASTHPRWSWGAQWNSLLRTGDNDQGYTLPDEHRVTGWASYLWTNAVSTSLRVDGLTRSNIDGIDAVIVGPVQTADPARYGRAQIDLGLGVNVAGAGALRGHRVGLEFMIPVYQDLDGPQLETDWSLNAGYRYSF
jgi:hypothetical protein